MPLALSLLAGLTATSLPPVPHEVALREARLLDAECGVPQGPGPSSSGPGSSGPGSSGASSSQPAPIQFVDMSAQSGIDDYGVSFGASAGDANGDGWPDLFVGGHYNGRAKLYLNMQNGTFLDVANRLYPKPNGDLHGALWSDLDADGAQELVVMRGAGYGSVPTPKLAYKRIDTYMVDLAIFASLDVPLMRARTPLAVDLDEDGWLDVFMTAAQRPDGQAPTAPYRHHTGHQFLDNWSGIGAGSTWSEFAVHGDLDGDRKLDLLVHGFPTRAFSYAASGLTNISAAVGLPNITMMRDAVIADFDNDGSNEIYVCRNDMGSALSRRYSNRIDFRTITTGQEHGLRIPVAGPHTAVLEWGPQGSTTPVLLGASGMVVPAASCSVVLNPANPAHVGIAPHSPGQVDAIHVGFDPATSSWIVVSSSTIWNECMFRFDCSIGTGSPTALGFNPLAAPQGDLLLKRVNGSYVDVTASSGAPANLRGHSVVAADFDNDRDLDLFVVTSTLADNTPDVVLQNDGAGNFTPVSMHGAQGSSFGVGDSAISLDYDRDGWVDLLVVNGDGMGFRHAGSTAFADNGPTQLFRNGTSNGNHWITVELVGQAPNMDAIGARIEVTAGGVTQVREVGGGTHRYSQNHGIHFGLGSATTADVRVVWPNGARSLRSQQPADAPLTVIQ
ncbi:MAG: CRTAC1 family protein [Planctomycetes bacterium]|nr:CRTAC1 family protein [Planctomycetota bacterium]